MAKRRRIVAPWGNRIVGTGEVEAGSLLANEQNWRIHPLPQQDQMGAALRVIGFVQSVIVNKRSAEEWGADRGVETLVDGHLRVQLALSQGEDTRVPVSYVDLDPAEERAVLATFDPLGALAKTDEDKLATLRAQVDVEFEELDLDIILRPERTKAKGLRHEVKECTCCQKKCRKGCGCYDDDRPKRAR